MMLWSSRKSAQFLESVCKVQTCPICSCMVHPVIYFKIVKLSHNSLDHVFKELAKPAQFSQQLVNCLEMPLKTVFWSLTHQTIEELPLFEQKLKTLHSSKPVQRDQMANLAHPLRLSSLTKLMP